MLSCVEFCVTGEVTQLYGIFFIFKKKGKKQ